MDFDLNVALDVDGFEVDLNVAVGLDDLEKSENGIAANEAGNGGDKGGILPQVEKVEPNDVDLTLDGAIRRNGEAIVDSKEMVKECVSIANEIERNLVVGSVFADVEHVYLLYCEYARCKGFSIRMGDHRYNGKSTMFWWKEFKCSWAGLPNCKSLMGQVGANRKVVVRTDCKAKIRVSRASSGRWSVILFEVNHNHAMLPIEQSYTLRSSRRLLYAKRSLLEALNSIGIGASRVSGFVKEDCGGPQNLGFTRKDAYHHMDPKVESDEKRWTKRAKVDMDSGPSRGVDVGEEFIDYVTSHAYEIANSTKDNEKARKLIIHRINELHRDATSILGASGIHDLKRSRKITLGVQFRDPKPVVRERGLASVRINHYQDSEKHKGKKKAYSPTPTFATGNSKFDPSSSKK